MVDTEAAEKMEAVTMYMSHWQKVVVLVQADFQEGWMAEEST